MTQRGPKTHHGRMAVRHNALTHGLRSRSPVVPGESEEEWQQHLAGIFESLQPVGHLEDELAALIALGIWRRWRIEYYEIASVTAHMAAAEEDLQIAQAYAEGTISQGILPEISPERIEAAQRRRIIPPDSDLDKIVRYKAAEHRQLIQNMHEFEALQARRGGHHSPLARVDFSGPPI